MMNDQLESHQGASGQYKVLEKVSPIKYYQVKTRSIIYYNKNIWSIQVINFHRIGLFSEKWNPLKHQFLLNCNSLDDMQA